MTITVGPQRVTKLFPGQVYRHRKGGEYRVLLLLGTQEATLEPVVIYASTENSRVWVRPVTEFLDGRFTFISGDIHA